MNYLDDVASLLVAEGIGTRAVDLFIGAKPVIPSGIGPFVSIAEYGGMGPMSTHDAPAGYRRPSIQIVSRASTYQVARAKADAAYEVLKDVRNTTLSGTFYLWIIPEQEPFELGLDEQGRPRIAFNISAMCRAS